ncbi:MAG: DNA-directed RNA polymerase subunit B [Nanoarchaeota archaeon]|nr:DNA-directed RNA polymerase subunit B [Nanoarchaeota archaeon]MBU4086443.1 DNA-directed RNA polymerase subunit B [Nanoarchaeota archaeon]
MKQVDKHLIMKKYLQQHSVVESNIVSFNNFVEQRMQQIVDELSKSLNNEEIEIRLGKIRIEKPNIIEADGSQKLITPTEARLRDLTYSAPIFLEISVKQGNQLETHDVEVGRIPVLVRSKVCNLYGLGKEELEKEYVDPLDPGGYFIVNGNERVMVMTEDLAANQPFIEKARGKLMLRLFSQRGAYKIPVSITETGEGILEISFSRFRNIPAVVMLKALGMLKEAEIARLVGLESDSFIVNLYEYANISSAEDAMMFIAEKTSLQGTKKEMLDRIKQRIDSYFMPHIGLDKESRYGKAITLCKFIKQFLVAKDNPDTHTDKDHYANKRVRLSGDLLSDLFRVNLNILLRDIQYSLQKVAKRKKFYSLKTIAKSTLFSHRVESAIATGSWIGERTGVTQNMDKTNYLAILSQLQRVSSMLPGEQENFAARTLHPTHYGRFCPIETPEGTEIGLRKNLALLARISTAIEMNEEEFIREAEKIGMIKEKENAEHGETDIFFNGRFIGSVHEHGKFVKEIRDLRRHGKLPIELSIRYDRPMNNVVISTEVGRVLRPLIIVENGKPRLNDEHLLMLEQDKIMWKDLVKQGVIEYLDASEEENALVSLTSEEITEEHSHLEVDQVSCLGIITSLVPYANHDHPPRLIKGSKGQKQSLSIYAANFPVRLDTDVSILHYPQKPIVRSFVYDTLNMYPAGQNIIVAVMTYEGYNMEDAVVLNKASVDRGLGRSTYFRPYSSIELNYPGGLSDQIEIPDKDTSGYRLEQSYKFLEDDGIAYPEARMSESEVVIGKSSPPKFLSEAREITIKTKKENSVAIRQEEKGTVDMVFITQDGEGNKVVQVRTRDQRIPEPGDKFSAPHGQKGVVGMIVPEEDIPFTSRGVKPDLMFNPHGIPGRMSVGYLLELVSGKVAAASGKIVDGTAFSDTNVELLESQLKELGFRFDGKETMYNGITGKMMTAKIFIGNMYYLKLKYMVANKMHARASGKVTMLTRQPIEGRSKGGALRLGEMEQQALVAHGASLLLKERYDSDKVVVHICTKCGAMAIKDTIRNRIICPVCNSNEIEPIEISYAFKLLLEELNSMHIATHFELKNKYE